MKKGSLTLGKQLLILGIALLLIAAVSCTGTSTPTTPSTTAPLTTAPTTVSPATSPVTTATGIPGTSPGVSPTVSASSLPSASPTATASPAGSPSPTASPAATSSPLATLPAGSTVEVLGVWGSSELDSFNAMVAPWQQATGGKMNFTGTRDLTAVLITRLQAGNPPDIAILPNPGLMKQFANFGQLKPLNPMLDMNTINQQYPAAWVNLGTVNNNLYAIFIKAANKSMIWYDPKVFSANGWNIPNTYSDLINLSNTIVAAKKTPANPWSVGVENAQASGWPATDWMAQYFLSKYGGDAYDQWVNHQIPWTDPRIKDAWNSFGTIVNTPNYVPGGATAVAATNFQSASYLPFESPPKAAMYYEGDFTEGFITTQFPNLVAGQDFDYFPFPPVSTSATASPSAAVSPSATPSPAASPSITASQSPTTLPPGAVTGGADLVCAFKDTPAVRSFIAYLATPEAQEIWVKRGGFVSVNKQVSINDYPDPIVQKSVQQLLNASVFRFGAGDSMPGAMQTAWWAGVLQYLQNPNQLDTILNNLENTAKTAYAIIPTPSASASATPAVSPSASPTPSPSASPTASSTP